MRRLLPLLIVVALAQGLQADVRLPALFGDYMVVQRQQPVRVWGWADAGETVSVEFAGLTASVSATEDGRWEVYLDPSEAGGPHELVVRGRNTVTLKDVMVGEVWVASGQSNMVWPLQRSNDAENEIAAADYPAIRYFKVALDTSDERREDVQGEWLVLSPDTAAELSGVAYFFARHLHGKLGVPFGILQSAWGGTPAEAWTSSRSLSANPALARMAKEFETEAMDAKDPYEAALSQWEQQAARAEAAGEEPPRKPSAPRSLRPQHKPAALFNAMVAPLVGYGIRGAIWYQGENNGSRGLGIQYRTLFRTLIEDWRREWGQGAFPFLFVQLANYARVPERSTWPELREAQAMALGLTGTGMAVTIDIGNSQDIHPRNKQDVGRRLALAARRVAYGETDLVHSGPSFRQATREGSKLRLWFDHAEGGLEARGSALAGFEIAGPDGNYVEADAQIAGNTVVVSSPQVKMPAGARYGWAADPDATLFNAEGLPASPFRTME